MSCHDAWKPHGSNMEGELPKHTRMGKPNSEGDVSRTHCPSTVMISGKGMKDLCVLCLCVLCLCAVLVCCACVLCLCAVLDVCYASDALCAVAAWAVSYLVP